MSSSKAFLASLVFTQTKTVSLGKRKCSTQANIITTQLIQLIKDKKLVGWCITYRHIDILKKISDWKNLNCHYPSHSQLIHPP